MVKSDEKNKGSGDGDRDVAQDARSSKGGSSKDAELLQEGDRGRLPSRKEIQTRIKTRKENRIYWRVWEYVRSKNRTLAEEYQLILEKKSEMSRTMREYLKNVMEYEPTEADIKKAEEVKARIQAMQEEE